MHEVKFPYKPNIATFTMSLMFLCGLTIYVGYIASTNTQGLILNRIIELSANHATIFYWSISVASGLLTLLGAITFIAALKYKKEIIVSGNTIIAPKSGISKKIITFDLNEVTDVYIQTIHKQKILNIVHPANKLSIPQSILPGKKAFEELTELIMSKVKG